MNPLFPHRTSTYFPSTEQACGPTHHLPPPSGYTPFISVWPVGPTLLSHRVDYSCQTVKTVLLTPVLMRSTADF